MNKIVFVSDYFHDQLIGGAELTTQALIEASPFEVIRVNSSMVSMELLQRFQDHFWIFGNFQNMKHELVPSIAANLKYAIVEYDYKFCKFRSIEKHKHATEEDCNCHDTALGKIISSFYYAADRIFWMSTKQEQVFLDRFPFLEMHGRVLGSVFSKEDLKLLSFLKDSQNTTEWLVQKSDSWIKGTEDAEAWCKENNLDYELFHSLSRNQLLNKMNQAKGFCFLPKGGDTCPRVVIEAKVLGCELHINRNVQMADEAWFSHGTPDSILAHLEALPERFWNDIKVKMDITSTIGAYTTTYNCISQGYPFEQCIESLLSNFDDVVVVDAGSTDGTWEKLQEIEGVRAFQHKVDFEHPRWAIHSDGDLKTVARKYLDTDWCWQMDVDEVIHPNQRDRIQKFLQDSPKSVDLIALPVVEYWGDKGKVRIDVNPWKWRVSRNIDGIIHGIPAELRLKDEDGNLYASHGTDSCDYVWEDEFKRVPFGTFYDEKAHELRSQALIGTPGYLEGYERWVAQIENMLPTVYHYSWYDIERKITSYKTHWAKFWKSMYNLDTEDTAENNVCFDKPWSDVTEDDIKILAQRLEEERGGHIFHEKIDWSKKVPWIELTKSGPLDG